MTITDREVNIRCDGCTKPARYIVRIKTPEPCARLYCSQHVAELLQRIALVLCDGESLHDYVETEHLLKGASIHA